MRTISSLLRNTFFNIFTNLLNRVGNTLLFILIIQRISVATAGAYDLGVTYFFVASRLALVGLGQLITRDVAFERGRFEKYLSNYFYARMIITTLVVALTITFVLLTNYGLSTKIVIVIMLMGVLPENVNELCRGVFFAHEEAHFDSLGAFINAVIKLSAGLIFVLLEYPLTMIVGAIFMGHFLSMVTNAIIIQKRYKPKWQRLDLPFLRSQIPAALPFVIIGTFYIMDNRIDKIFLSFLSDEEAIGLYGAATAIIVAFSMVPESYRMAILPIMARLKAIDETQLHIVYGRSIKLMMILGIPLSAATFLLSENLIRFLYRDSLPLSVYALQIMGLSLCFIFLNAINTRVLLVYDRHMLTAVFMLVSATVNIVLLFWLIPKIGLLGAAIGTAVSHLLRFLFLNHAASKLAPLDNVSSYIWKVLVATFMMVVLLLLTQDLSLWIQTFLGATSYFVVILAARTLDSEEQSMMKKYIQQLWRGLNS